MRTRINALLERFQVCTFLLLLNPLRPLRADLQQVNGRADVFTAGLYFSLDQSSNSHDQSIFPETGTVFGQAVDRFCFAKKTRHHLALTIVTDSIS